MLARNLPFIYLLILKLCLLSLWQGFASAEKQKSDIHVLFKSFVSHYWKHGDWYGASSWTGDNASRLMVSYLSFLEDTDSHGTADEIFTNICSRSLNKWTLLQFLTQGHDDFGWTVLLLLDLLKYSYIYEERYGNSSFVAILPALRNRLAFRASFLHDVMEDSWSSELCGGGAEWKVRIRKSAAWPSLYRHDIYKNTITNHLYVGNNARAYKAYPGKPSPVEITEIAVHKLRIFWKFVRPLFGWPKGRFRTVSFMDNIFRDRALESLNWMDNAQLLTNDSLFIDGKRIRFAQDSPEHYPTVMCDVPDNAIYTYNQLQGILALRSLSQTSGSVELLRRGHQTVSSFINASYSGKLGSNGILEDRCDRFGNCTQDMQVFKGLAFLELKSYCEPLETQLPGESREWHLRTCQTYLSWVKANAAAAYATVDPSGRFSGYWGLNKTDQGDLGRGRTVETQIAALAVLLSSAWFERKFG